MLWYSSCFNNKHTLQLTQVFWCQVVSYWEEYGHWLVNWSGVSCADSWTNPVHVVEWTQVLPNPLAKDGGWNYFDSVFLLLSWVKMGQVLSHQHIDPQPRVYPLCQYTPVAFYQTCDKLNKWRKFWKFQTTVRWPQQELYLMGMATSLSSHFQSASVSWTALGLFINQRMKKVPIAASSSFIHLAQRMLWRKQVKYHHNKNIKLCTK